MVQDEEAELVISGYLYERAHHCAPASGVAVVGRPTEFESRVLRERVHGLGSDFDGGPFMPADLRHVGELPNVTAELLRRGHSETDVRKILGENLLRVLAAAERAAGSPSESSG